MIEQIKKWISAAVDAFMRGARGDALRDGSGKPAGKGMLILRDGILFFLELILTSAAIFTFVWAGSFVVRFFLAGAILISGMRTYNAAKQLQNTVFGA